jgi:hypothetical protein
VNARPAAHDRPLTLDEATAIALTWDLPEDDTADQAPAHQPSDAHSWFAVGALVLTLAMVLAVLTGCASAPTRHGPAPDAVTPLTTVALWLLVGITAAVLAGLGARSAVRSIRKARRDDVAKPSTRITNLKDSA